ncbi:pili assembly chaperone, partial [Salmonella enterica]|nr:pili assembly chaperone [Salmonella enterica]
PHLHSDGMTVVIQPHQTHYTN